MELNEISNLDEVKKALRDRYLKTQLGHIQAGHGTLDELKNQSDDDIKGSWVDWYSDPMFGGLSSDDFEEDSFDKDTVLKILNDKGTMPTKDEIIKYVSDNLNNSESESNNEDMMTVEEYSPANEEFRLYVHKVYGDGPFTVEELKEYENEFDDYFNYGDEGLEELDEILYGDKQKDKKPEATDVSSIAKSLTQNDLGRSL